MTPSSAYPRFRSPALVRWLVLLWCFGVEIGPNLHLGMHGWLAPHEHATGHRHAADGHDAAPHDSRDHHAADHAHPHPEHPPFDEHPLRSPDGRGRTRALDPDHGAHDAMHRGQAVLVVPRADPVPASAACESPTTPSWIVLPACDRPARDVRARGPPAASAASSLIS